MKRHLLLALILAGCGSSSNPSSFGGGESEPVLIRAQGALPADAATIAGLPKALDPSLIATGVTPKVTSADLSPVLDQGYLESCGAFGIAYETCGYEIRKAGGLSTSPADSISPAFMYRKVCDIEKTTAAADANGTYAKDYFNFLVHHSPVNFATLGYPAPTSSAQQAAVIDGLSLSGYTTDNRLRIGSWSTLPQSSDPSGIKAQIDAGHVVGVLVQLRKNFNSFYHNTGVFKAKGDNTGGHFMCVVGYDDSRQAFRVQNSWGTDFGDQGFMWWDYTNFMSNLSEAYIAEPVADVSPGSSGGALSGGSSNARLVSLHQAQQASTGKVYLIFRMHLDESLSLDNYTVVTPGNTRITHQYHGHALNSGRIYLSRQDGRQWPSGRYTITLRGRNAQESPVELTGSAQLSPISGAPDGEPAQVQGSDEQAGTVTPP